MTQIVVITRIARPYWIASRLILLGLAALFIASAAATVVRGRLSQGGTARDSTSATPLQENRPDPLSAFLPIARRDLFAGVRAGEESPRRSAARAAAPDDLRLLGTGGAGESRFAVIENKKEREQTLVRIGEDFDGAEVTEIEWRRLVLRRGGKDEVLVVDPEVTVGTSKSKKRAKSKSGASKGSSKVKEIGEDRFLIGRDEVNHQLENLSTLFTQMRAVPSMKDGATQGFRIFAIRRGSLFQQIGLRNNDVVQRINGLELTDPTRAMGLFEELKGETRLTVDVLRGGEPRTLSYEIR